MIRNRRNYYRILHVQPEAPDEVIKASWRALMQTRRGHPDLGGDPEAAALINEAYAVLSDPVRRKAYDRQRQGSRHWRVPEPPEQESTRTAPPRSDPSRWRADGCCPLCRAPLPLHWSNEPRCQRCEAPLSPTPGPAGAERELLGRRLAVRRARSDPADLLTDFRGATLRGQLVDVSLGGAALLATSGLPVGSAVRVMAGAIDAVGQVVACHRTQLQWKIRVSWLTAKSRTGKGVYVRARA